MKLSKAIETNEYLVELSLLHQCQDHADAIKLGIEALKRINDSAKLTPYEMQLPLPGETKE